MLFRFKRWITAMVPLLGLLIDVVPRDKAGAKIAAAIPIFSAEFESAEDVWKLNVQAGQGGDFPTKTRVSRRLRPLDGFTTVDVMDEAAEFDGWTLYVHDDIRGWSADPRVVDFRLFSLAVFPLSEAGVIAIAAEEMRLAR